MNFENIDIFLIEGSQIISHLITDKMTSSYGKEPLLSNDLMKLSLPQWFKTILTIKLKKKKNRKAAKNHKMAGFRKLEQLPF